MLVYQVPGIPLVPLVVNREAYILYEKRGLITHVVGQIIDPQFMTQISQGR